MTLEITLQVVTIISIVVGIYVAIKKTMETHDLVNSRMTEILELTRTSSKAQGVKEERERHDIDMSI